MMQMPKLGSLPMVAALAAVVSLTAPALAAQYRFVVVADHERDNFNQGSFACATINQHGEVAFKAARTAGVNSFDGTYRANTDGTITAIVEDPDRAQFTFTGNFTSINDKGEVALGANLAGPEFVNVIVRGDGRVVNQVTTIASTAGATARDLGFVNFNVSVNTLGEVAFMGGLDPPGWHSRST